MPIILTEAVVIEMRARYRAGESPTAIGNRFGVVYGTVKCAVFGESWAHVPGAVEPGERHSVGRRKGVPYNAAAGERHGMSKLTEEAVILSRRLYLEGKTGMAIAEQLGLNANTIYSALKGLSWSHIPGALDLSQIQRERKLANPPPPRRKPGEACRGALNANAKLTDRSVARARALYRKGETADSIAMRFGVTGSTLRVALLGETWSHVPGELAPSEMRPSGRSYALDAAGVAQVRALYRKGATMTALATKFGVSFETVRNALSGETYSHIPGELAPSEFRKRGRPRGS